MTIKENNAPIKDKMEKSGFRFVHKENKAYFVDADGKYEPYPVGYITGPTQFERGFYVSVKGKDGWIQKDGTDISELANWAVEVAQKQLAETWG